MENTEQDIREKKWYDHTWVVVLLLFFFMPIGLYALWKNNYLSKDWKIGGALLALLMMSFSIKNARNAPPSSSYTFKEIIIFMASQSIILLLCYIRKYKVIIL